MENFESFLAAKKIDAIKFEKGDPVRYQEFRELFLVMHPDSLVAQKLFLINSIRRKFPFTKEQSSEAQKQNIAKAKPKITPKIKK